MAHAFFEDTQEMECVFIGIATRDPSLDGRELWDELARIDSGRPVSRGRAGLFWREVVRVRVERARAATRAEAPRNSRERSLDSPSHWSRASDDLAEAVQIEEALRRLEALQLEHECATRRGVAEALAGLLRRIVDGFRGDRGGPGSPTPPSPLPGARIPVSRRRVKSGPFPRPFAGSER